MARYAALLRGVNLGSHNKVAMPALRALVEGLGHTDVATYIQSGNVVFTAGSGSAAAVASKLENAIEKEFGFDVPVVVRTKAQLATLIKGNPFADPSKVHVAFLSAAPKAAALKAIDRDAYAPEEFAVKGKDVYLHLPNGVGRAKLTHTVLERKLGVGATYRNWTTVNKLHDML